MNRREFLQLGGAIAVAPAFIQIDRLMPVRPLKVIDTLFTLDNLHAGDRVYLAYADDPLNPVFNVEVNIGGSFTHRVPQRGGEMIVRVRNGGFFDPMKPYEYCASVLPEKLDIVRISDR